MFKRISIALDGLPQVLKTHLKKQRLLFPDPTHQTTNNSDIDGETMSTQNVVIVVGVVCIVAAVAIAGIFWVGRKLRRPGKVKHIRCPSEEDSSPKRALIRVSDDDIKTSKT